LCHLSARHSFPTRRSSDLSASLNLPLGAQTAKPDLKLSFAGQVLRARTRLEAELEGQAIVAKLDAPSIEAATIAQLVPELALRADRKSTRLNSSHVKISYA